MPNDKLTSLSLGVALIMIAHGTAAWLGWVKGSPMLNFLGAGFVLLYMMFRKR